jgi:hypothetical protein
MHHQKGLRSWLRLTRGIPLSPVHRACLKVSALKSSKLSSKAGKALPVQESHVSNIPGKKTQDFLNSLNEEQYRAALCRSPAVRVKAGPGR